MCISANKCVKPLFHVDNLSFSGAYETDGIFPGPICFISATSVLLGRPVAQLSRNHPHQVLSLVLVHYQPPVFVGVAAGEGNSVGIGEGVDAEEGEGEGIEEGEGDTVGESEG